IGLIWLDDGLACRRIGILGEDKTEADAMADLAEFVARVKPLIVTWNGRSFDLPVLALRALRHGVDYSWYYRGLGYRYRFSADGRFGPLLEGTDRQMLLLPHARERPAPARSAGAPPPSPEPAREEPTEGDVGSRDASVPGPTELPEETPPDLLPELPPEPFPE